MLALALVLTLQSPKPIAIVSHPPINEMSGIIKSRTYPNVFWVHNDSGDSARIFSIGLDGKPVTPRGKDEVNPELGQEPWPGIRIDGARNIDFEDIAIDGKTLYVADVGNNGNARRNLGVYVVREPDPRVSGAVRKQAFWQIAYPDQKEFPPKKWDFDCEAVFVWRHKLYFVTKRRIGSSVPDPACSLYRLDNPSAEKTNLLAKLGSKDLLGGWVTAADVSPDGKRFAVLTHVSASIWLFDIDPEKGPRLDAPCRQIPLGDLKQCEALCFESNDSVIVGNEQRELYRVKL